MARDSGQPATEAWALYDAARLGCARLVHIRLSELASELSGEVPVALADAAGALADSDFERPAPAADTFERHGLWLHAAEAVVSSARMAHDAGRLNLSVRTVDNYLGRAYVKLGVTSRANLARLLYPSDQT